MKNARVALLVHNYFEQSEFDTPKRFLTEAGAKVTVVSASAKTLQAMNHAERAGTYTADKLLGQDSHENYDILVLPGGVINADHLRMSETARQWVLRFLDSGRLIAAICHAPWLLVSADVVEERRLTSYFTLQDDIRNAGGEWVDYPVIIDGNLITSRNPGDLQQFCEAIVGWTEAPERQLA